MKELRCIALFAVIGFIKKLSLIDYVNIYLFLIFFQLIFPCGKVRVTPHCLYRDSLTLIYHISSNRRRTLAALLITPIEVSVPPKSATPLP